MSYQGFAVQVKVVRLLVGYGLYLTDLNGRTETKSVTSLEEVFDILDSYEAI